MNPRLSIRMEAAWHKITFFLRQPASLEMVFSLQFPVSGFRFSDFSFRFSEKTLLVCGGGPGRPPKSATGNNHIFPRPEPIVNH
jgi:hypothetical protein